MKNLPRHVAIIMDGNGRWAQQRKWPRILGHRAGAKAVRRAVEFAVENNIEVLSLFALSIENCLYRPRLEVDYLFKLFLEALKSNIIELNDNNVKVEIVGDRQGLRTDLHAAIDYAENFTKNNNGLKLIIALNYSGRWDIVSASKCLARAVANGELAESQIDEQSVSQFTAFSHLPDVDLLIRTSGEKRISNFVLWQSAYAELYFTDVYWPDFDAATFRQAINWYCCRERRFGQTTEQLEMADA